MFNQYLAVRDGERIVGAVLHEPPASAVATSSSLLLTLDSTGHAIVQEFVLPAAGAAPRVVHRSVLPVLQPTAVAGLPGPASNVRALVGTRAGDLCLFEWHTTPVSEGTVSATTAKSQSLVAGGVLVPLRQVFVGGIAHVAVDAASRFCVVAGETANATYAVALCWLGVGKSPASLLCVLPVDNPVIALATLTVAADGSFKVCGFCFFRFD
jgi:hypothetical protein